MGTTRIGGHDREKEEEREREKEVFRLRGKTCLYSQLRARDMRGKIVQLYLVRSSRSARRIFLRRHVLRPPPSVASPKPLTLLGLPIPTSVAGMSRFSYVVLAVTSLSLSLSLFS